jgi:hypothetical protein
MDFSARAATKGPARFQAPPVLYATAPCFDSTQPKEAALRKRKRP